MDGPIDGPSKAFAALERLNPLQPRSSAAAATAASSSADSVGFALLRPAAVKGALVSEICQRFERRGLTLCAMRMLKPGADLAKNHYATAAKADLVPLVSALAPGPVIAMLWSGAGALSTLRLLVGDEDAARALPGTIRGDLSVVKLSADPLIELASDEADVARLRSLWFEASDLAASAPSLATAPTPPPPSAPAAGNAAGASTAYPESATLPPLPPKPDCGKFYITTAINYANGAPHMGHAYEAVASDVIARYHRAYGRTVYSLTGADEHGQKIADTAAKEGIAPIELCNRCVAQFQELGRALNCEFDGYVRTTSDAHKAIARKLWTRCENKGGVYIGTYVGWYNVREETFVTETDAAANDFKDPSSGVPLKKMEEPSYFFKLSEYQSRLIEHIKAHPDFIVPEVRRNEVLERLAVPLTDLSVSRTTFDWGITVPGEIPGHVMYVWFDALSNYISGIGYDPLAKTPSKSSKDAHFWPADVHLIGKDIIWFHCVIWPALLMCAEVPLPKTVLAHGFVHGPDGRKMSKSFGNVVNPHDVLQSFPVDSFRFFLLREATFGGDVTFNETALALRHNSELADTFGNLVNRSLNLCKSYNGGKIPSQLPIEIDWPGVDALRTGTEQAYARYQLDVAASLATGALHAVNKFLTDHEPWKIKDNPAKRLAILRTTLEAIYVATHFLAPFLTDGAAKVFAMLNTPPLPICQLRTTLTNLKPETQTSVGEIMYAKAETKEALAAAQAKAEEEKKAKAEAAKKQAAKAAAEKAATAGGDGGTSVSILDIRVGQIVSVERHPEADGLYVEKIDLGESAPRTVVSGLVKHVPIEEMRQRKVVVLCNLKPSKLKGVESQAMVLCGKTRDEPCSKMELVEPPAAAKVGERISFAGVAGEPLDVLPPKKKLWEKLMPQFNTSDSKRACFESLTFDTSAGPCTVASIAGGAIG